MRALLAAFSALSSLSLYATPTADPMPPPAAVKVGECTFAEYRICKDCDQLGAYATPAQDCELKSGLWAAKGGNVTLWKNGEVMGVNRASAARESVLPNGVRLNPNAYIGFHRNGRPSYAHDLIADTELAPGIWAKARGSYVFWYESGRLQTVEVLARPYVRNGKKLARACQTLNLNEDGSFHSAEDSYACK